MPFLDRDPGDDGIFESITWSSVPPLKLPGETIRRPFGLARAWHHQTVLPAQRE
jgi:hypothetical protein